ncbi:MAG: AMP-binding protein [Cyclobacteriaceae bacterium]|nr:AMP-binding protein [Cyclobacteriaceae bacterium]
MTYSFDSIWINQRKEAINSIIQGETKPLSDYEANTFEFIKLWLSGQANFELQTSGSTGSPKPITLKRPDMIASANRTVSALDLKRGTTALVCLDIRYIAGKMMLVRALENNMVIVMVEPSADPFKNLPAGTSIDFMAVVPLQLQTIIANRDYHDRLNSLAAVLVGGAPVSVKLTDDLQRFTCPVYETYGMTETLSNVALKLLNTPAKADHFKVLPEISIDTDPRECLVIHDHLLTNNVVTNDLVALHQNGFQWIGRIDNVINTGGIKVSPESIEGQLGAILGKDFDHQFFISGTPHEKLGEQVTLFVAAESIPDKTLALLKCAIDQLKAKAERPKKIIIVDKFRETTTGKIDRKATRNSVPRSITDLTIN